MDPLTIHRRRWAILAILSLSVFLVVVDNTIVNVALPTLSRDLGASTSQLQWIVDAYSLVFAGLLLAGGSLGDRLGRKGALQIGLVLFGLTSVFAASADSAGQLIAARAAMGVGAALVFPATLAILTNVFTDPAERAKAIGIWAGVVRSRRRPRSGDRRLAPRALLVGIGVLRQRADRDRRPRRRSVPPADLPRPARRAVRPARHGALDRRRDGARLHSDRGARERMDLADHRRRVRPRRRAHRRVHRLGAARGSRRCSTSVFSATPDSAPPARRWRSAFFALFGFIFLVTQYFQFVRGYSTL